MPIMYDKEVVEKYEDRVIKTKSGSVYYMIKNRSRHVYLDRSFIPYDQVETLNDDHQLYSFPIGKPLNSSATSEKVLQSSSSQQVLQPVNTSWVAPNISLASPTSTGYCRDNDHKNGLWVISEHEARNKSFLCCGWDDPSVNQASCLTEASYNGQCTYLKRGTSNTTQGIHAGGHACSCDAKYGSSVVSPREKFIWKPRNCNLLSWNASLFCNLLGKRRMLLVGDSTVMQSAATLLNMINFNGGMCGDNIYIGQSSKLQWAEFGVHGCGQDTTLSSAIDYSHPDIVIMNIGAHLGDVGDLDAILFALLGVIKKSTADYNTTFVWKTQNPGAWNCDSFHSPSETDGYPISEGQDRYKWNNFPLYDDYARKNTKRYGFKILDMSPLYYRPDAHVGGSDCLHFCLPGPVDIFPIVLLQMLYNREI